MVNRCKPNFPSRKYYYDKGITVCERWMTFENFQEDIGPMPTPRHTLDRIDGMLGYGPHNCRWATYKEQARNVSNNRIVNFNGTLMTVAELCENINEKPNTIVYRILRGWTDNEAINGVRKIRHLITKDKVTKKIGPIHTYKYEKFIDEMISDRKRGDSTVEISRKYGIDTGHLWRLFNDWNVKPALTRSEKVAAKAQKARKMIEGGMTYSQVAKELNVAQSTVSNYMKTNKQRNERKMK